MPRNADFIGLALVGAVKGYKTVIVMPDSVSEERRKLVRQYGAEVILVHDAGNIGDAIAECCAIAQRMAAENPKVFVPEQFSNPANPAAHRHGTALEIMEQAARPIHGFCSGVGTGGTLSGIGEVLKAQNPGIEIWAVEPKNAAILAGGTVGTHLQMGIGGISAGTNVFAALKLAKRLGRGKTVVTILPDTAERYFSTPLFDFED